MEILLKILLVLACIVGGLLALLLLFWGFTIICSLFITKKEYTKNSKFYRFLLNANTAICTVIFRTKIKVNGLDKLPKDSRFVLVSNHRSNFDPEWTWLVTRKYNVAFLTKEKNLHIFAFGKIIRKCCFLAIDRENPRNALTAVKKSVDLINNNQVSIGVYPEGTRNFEAKGLLPFHDCVFKIAQMANVPLVIMTVTGTEQIHKNFPKRKTEVTLNFLEVVPAEQLQGKRTNEIGEYVRKVMLDNLEPNGQAQTTEFNSSSCNE